MDVQYNKIADFAIAVVLDAADCECDAQRHDAAITCSFRTARACDAAGAAPVFFVDEDDDVTIKEDAASHT